MNEEEAILLSGLSEENENLKDKIGVLWSWIGCLVLTIIFILKSLGGKGVL